MQPPYQATQDMLKCDATEASTYFKMSALYVDSKAEVYILQRNV